MIALKNLLNEVESDTKMTPEELKKYASENCFRRNPIFSDPFVAIPKGEMNYMYDPNSVSNACETNVFKFIKNNSDEYYPVAGWLIYYGVAIEHFWLYKKSDNKFYDITPLRDRQYPLGYIGLIDKNINDDIVKANSVWDLEFFKLGYLSKFLK